MTIRTKIGLCFAIAIVSSVVLLFGETCVGFVRQSSPGHFQSYRTFAQLLSEGFPLAFVYGLLVAVSVASGWSSLDNVSRTKALAVSLTSALAFYILTIPLFKVGHLSPPIAISVFLGGLIASIWISLRYFSRLPERISLFTVFAFILLAVYLAKSSIWYAYRLDPVLTYFKTFTESSSAARWWRCNGSSRPILASGTQAWELHYSWETYDGTAAELIDFSSNGSVTYRSKNYGQTEWIHRSVQLSKEELTKVARTVDDVGLLCQSTETRYPPLAYQTRHVLQVRANEWMLELVNDSNRTFPDPAAMGDVYTVLKRYRGDVPEEEPMGLLL